MLTTTTSPGSSSSGRSANMWWLIDASPRRATRSLTPSRARPRASGGSWASSAGASSNASAVTPAPPFRRRWPAPARGSGRSGGRSLDQPEQARHALLRRWAVGDVLAREGILVHLRAHVARIDGVDPQRRVLLGEDRRELVERGLRGAVAAPARVRLDRGVGAHVDDRAAVRHPRQDQLRERDGGEHVDLIDAFEHVQRVATERRLRARPEHCSRC